MTKKEKLEIYQEFLFTKVGILKNIFVTINESLNKKKLRIKMDWKNDINKNFWDDLNKKKAKNTYFIESYLNNLYSLLNIFAIYINYYKIYTKKDNSKIVFDDLIKDECWAIENNSGLKWVNNFTKDIKNKSWYNNFTKYRKASTHRVCIIVPKVDCRIVDDEYKSFDVYLPKNPDDLNSFKEQSGDIIKALPIIKEIHENMIKFFNENEFNIKKLL